ITLEAVAYVANMTKNAFCKYFKKYTNKTYGAFLNELRIEHACKLILSPKNHTISNVAYKVGFNNISNFNRQFKKVKHQTPLNFKNERSSGKKHNSYRTDRSRPVPTYTFKIIKMIKSQILDLIPNYNSS